MKLKLKLVSVITVAMLLVCYGTPHVSGAFYVGQSVGFGSVSKTCGEQLDAGILYDEAYIKDELGNTQYVQTLTFDATDGECIPIVYSKYAGYGATTYDSATAAEAAGYDVKAAVNGSFFGLTGENANIYGGVCISDGRIMQGNNTYEKNWVLAINSNGTAELVESKMEYTLSVNGEAWHNGLECINICHSNPYDVIYYYDEFCGDKTDASRDGVEVVFEKQNGSSLIVGGVLVGRVVEIRDHIKTGGEIGVGRFVLYSPDTSPWAQRLRELKPGDTSQIAAYESIDESREVMEKCNSALVTYGYHIVKNGTNVTSSDGLPESQNKSRGPRCALGIKADGSMVIVNSYGRSEEHPGLTVYELADMLISMKCVTAVNLDGGNSAQMVTEDASGVLVQKTEQLRRVANSLLLVARTGTHRDVSEAHETALNKARLLLAGYVLEGDVDAVKDEIAAAERVRSDSMSMGPDYISSTSRLYEAMEKVKKIGYLPGVYHLGTEQYIYPSEDLTGEAIYSIHSDTSLSVTEVKGNLGYTKYRDAYGWIDLASADFIGENKIVAAQITAPQAVYRGDGITLSWSSPDGAAGFSYKVIALDTYPSGSDNDSEGALVIAERKNTRDLCVAVSASSLRGKKYVKVAVCVDYPTGRAWSVAYIACSELPFYDVSVDHWGYKGVLGCYENGLFRGTSDTTFEPDGHLTRAMMATLVYRMANSPTVPTDALRDFDDVDADSWYAEAVRWCQSQGIVYGLSEDVFAPDDYVTREQVACFLYRYARYCGCDTSVGDVNATLAFADGGSISRYAREAMAWVTERGIMNGAHNYLTPRDTATRVQAAKMLDLTMSIVR